jgi:uncharacterized lipoprotein
MNKLLVVATVLAALGLAACGPETQQQKDAVAFQKACAANPSTQACKDADKR